MKYYGIDSKGLIKVQEVDDLPAWTSDCKRRFIYNNDDNLLYYGTDTAWSLVREHTHANKSLLDKFTEDDGYLNFDGNLIGGVLTIADAHLFDTTITRDDYFISNPSELLDQLFVLVSNTLYQYRVDTWVDVTAAIRGPVGPIGFGTFTIRAVGPLTEKDAYDSEDEGFSFLAVDTQQLYIRWGSVGTWGGPYDFPNLTSSGLDDWERFPGYYLETLFDSPTTGTITENLKLSLNDSIFATRVTVENLTGFTTTVECPTLSINRQSVMVESANSIVETITNIL